MIAKRISFSLRFDRKESPIIKTKKVLAKVISYYMAVFVFCIILFTGSDAFAQQGFFAKFSIGSGFTKEYSRLNESGISIVTKNHSIGYGITNKFAVQIGEFGGLNKIKVGNYNYINLDVFGLGFCYLTPIDFKVSVIGGYSIVSYANEWSESFGDKGGNGYGFNISLDKEWFFANKWAIRVGPQLFWIKTTDTNYDFINASINASLLFYLNQSNKIK